MGGKGSGPRPRPTALKGLFGVKDRARLNPAEPVLAPAGEVFDTPPADLDGDAEAIAEWTKVVPTLRRVGLVSDLEQSSLIGYCRVWSRLQAAERELRASGLFLPGESGVVVHPAVKVANESIDRCLRYWQEFGMTPAARSRMVSLIKRDTPAVSKWAGVL